MSVSDRELEKILDELTVREIVVVLKLADMIVRRMRVYTSRIQRYTATYASTSDIIAEIVRQAVAQQMSGAKPVEEEEIETEKIKEFIGKLRKALGEKRDSSPRGSEQGEQRE